MLLQPPDKQPQLLESVESRLESGTMMHLSGDPKQAAWPLFLRALGHGLGIRDLQEGLLFASRF